MISVAILTVSDSASEGTRQDVSGPAIANRCQELGWTIAATAVVPDEETIISRQLREWVDNEVAKLVLTTGGTGVSARDNTPEATRKVLDRELPGVSEHMRAKGLEQTHFAVLSRGLAGTRGQAFIVNLPGSPSGALESFSVVEDLVPHVLSLLEGQTEHGTRGN